MKHKAAIFFLLVFAQTLNAWAVFGQNSELVFPIASAFPSVLPQVAGFAFGGQVGFKLVITNSPYKLRLFSFSVTQARIIDELDLEPDFGVSQSLASIPAAGLKVHEESGLVLIYGQHSDGTQRLIAFQSQRDAHLRRLWSVSFPPNAFISAASDLAVNADGSRICWIYYLPAQSSLMDEGDHVATPITTTKRPLLARLYPAGLKLNEGTLQGSSVSHLTRHLALIRADDGVQLASAELNTSSFFASVFFDEAKSRVVALEGKTAFVFAPVQDRLDLEFTVDPEIKVSDVVGQGISKDGRFLVGYGGYNPDQPDSGINSYVSYDLEQRTARELDLREALFPVSNGITFHQGKGILLAPLTIELTISTRGESSQSSVAAREADVIALGLDGTLTRVAQLRLPKRSPESARPNALSSYGNIEVSATGALAFISSGNGRLFTFDTSNGEIVRDALINPNGLVSIKLLEPLNRLLASDLSNRFLLLDVETAPVISGIALKRQATIINGETFLNGAHVFIDGVDLGIANRSADNPGGEIVVDRGKKDFSRGQHFTFVVVNPDGMPSKPFTLQR